jgi:hypothetical protein
LSTANKSASFFYRPARLHSPLPSLDPRPGKLRKERERFRAQASLNHNCTRTNKNFHKRLKAETTQAELLAATLKINQLKGQLADQARAEARTQAELTKTLENLQTLRDDSQARALSVSPSLLASPAGNAEAAGGSRGRQGGAAPDNPRSHR